MTPGNTSGTPPTAVATTNNPQLAASTIAVQNASVNEQFKKISPRRKMFGTSSCFESPKNSIFPLHSFLCVFSHTSRKCGSIGPDPAIMKRTFLFSFNVNGISFARR